MEGSKEPFLKEGGDGGSGERRGRRVSAAFAPLRNNANTHVGERLGVEGQRLLVIGGGRADGDGAPPAEAAGLRREGGRGEEEEAAGE
jgi:hypothetical protein